MAFLISPGVEVNEIDSTNVVPALATSVGGYVGEFAWGPRDRVLTVSSEKDLASIYGVPSSTDYEVSFFTAASFLKYGNALRVRRAVPSDAANATSSNISPDIYDTAESISSGSGFTAKYAGELGNGLSVVVVTPSNYTALKALTADKTVSAAMKTVTYAPSTTDFAAEYDVDYNDEVHVIVVDTEGSFSGIPYTVLEVWQGLSLGSNAKTPNGAANYINAVLNSKSAYIFAKDVDLLITGATSSETISGSGAAFITNGYIAADGTYVLSGGQNGTSGASHIVNTLEDAFSDAESNDVNFIFAQNFDGADSDINNDTINDTIASLANDRKDIIGFISAPIRIHSLTAVADKKAAVLAAFADISPKSSYVVFDSSPVQMYNKYADRFVWVSAAGHMAGLCANADLVSEPWFSPAGLNRGQLRGVSRLAYNPGQVDRDDLYLANINSIITVPGSGIVLYGDKTASPRPSAFDRINVRRLFITVQKAIASFAKFQLFELNDEFTRSAFRSTVDAYLRDIQGRRGIIDYRVICDATNNTPVVIDSNRFVADIYIKPERSINFITLNFIATRTGIEFREIVGS